MNLVTMHSPPSSYAEAYSLAHDSRTASAYVSLSVMQTKFYTHINTGKNESSILILDIKREDKRSWTEW
jgi:hypothetical protein